MDDSEIVFTLVHVKPVCCGTNFFLSPKIEIARKTLDEYTGQRKTTPRFL